MRSISRRAPSSERVSALELPQPLLQRIVNKGGHMLGYGILALAYWRMFEFREGKFWLAWLFAVLYAVTDEFHQSFVPGRHPAWFDVLVFDNLGALISLLLAALFLKLKQPDKLIWLSKKEI